MRSLRRSRRRRTARQVAGWSGQYALAGSAADGWCACRVLDVSFDGARLELLAVPARVGQRLLVELQVTGPNVVASPLRAIVRHTASGLEGGQVVGIEFSDVDDAALALLRLLISVQSA
jgi:hypothetical protein